MSSSQEFQVTNDTSDNESEVEVPTRKRTRKLSSENEEERPRDGNVFERFQSGKIVPLESAVESSPEYSPAHDGYIPKSPEYHPSGSPGYSPNEGK